MLKKPSIKKAPKSHKEAVAVGAKFFFTGKLCKRGHRALRYAHGSCLACKEENRKVDKNKKAEYFRKWRKANPHKQKEYRKRQKELGYSKRYYQLNRKREIERATKWRKENPEKFRAMRRRYYDANKEKFRRIARENSKRDKKKKLKRQREIRAANREKYREKTRVWRRKYPERARISTINKKARRKAAPGKFTIQDVVLKFEKQKGQCIYCRIDIKNNYHIDHKKPLARGGTNWPHNIQLLCPTCNMEKHTATHAQFVARRKAA